MAWLDIASTMLSTYGPAFQTPWRMLLLKSSCEAKIPEYFLRNKVYLYYPGTHLIVRRVRD